MTDLYEAKTLVSSRFVGTKGVHAVGLRKKSEEITVFFDEGTSTEVVRNVIDEVGELVKPFRVFWVIEGQPRLHAG